ncbi:hypothetical protein IMPR6_60012 [Imperialibacter sp. EC-SDR9]|nr:hypothetical protein IMPERIA89_240075 [Imperialibacter sp. 89]CAD5272247.1 hypothetical protein IMPERIA75_390075 [Imperialibacter sp. 75]VVT32064.1 hypothetical protein IMPR6_60012 [Imperialibacter sp. EC-SDR9]
MIVERLYAVPTALALLSFLAFGVTAMSSLTGLVVSIHFTDFLVSFAQPLSTPSFLKQRQRRSGISYI